MTDLARSTGDASTAVAGQRPPRRDRGGRVSEADAAQRLAAAGRPAAGDEPFLRQHRPGQRPDGVQLDSGRVRDGDVDLRRSARRVVPRDHRRELDDRHRPGGARKARTRSALATGRPSRDRAAGRSDPSAPTEQLVVDDVVIVQPGDQVIADGTVLSATDLRLDQSILTGESEPVARVAGEEMLSGAFVVEGTGAYRVTAVGERSFAARVTGQARSFRHPRSPLERAINRLLYALVGLVIVLGAVLGYSLYHRHAPVHTAVATSAAGRGHARARRIDGAGRPHLCGGGRAHVAAGRAGAAAERDRVAGFGRHHLHRQDRDVDRVGAARGRGHAGQGGEASEGSPQPSQRSRPPRRRGT